MTLLNAPTPDRATQPLSAIVLDYGATMRRLVDRAKRPDFTEADWAPLAALVATDTFRRVGHQLEVMDWPTYTAFLTRWASAARWEGVFRRITEVPGRVFLELEERSTVDGRSDVVNTVSVYEFDGERRLCHLDIYLAGPAR